MRKPLDIAIVGAGVGGLAAATLLAQSGHSVRLFDQFDAPRPLGSGLVIQPVGLAVLDRIGAGPAVRQTGAKIRRMIGHEALSGVKVLDVVYERPGRPGFGLAIHRASLFDALLVAASHAGVALVTGSQVVAAPLTPAGRILQFAGDREAGPFDLVVDASGVHSRLSPLQARPLPYGAIWASVPWPEASGLPRDQLTQRYSRANRMAGVLPIGTLPGADRAMAAVFWSLPLRGFDLWQAADLAVWKAEAVALWPEIAAFLTGITRHDQMTQARYSHGTLRTPHAEGLVFIGDAAHRASPQLGQGANMALLDALALAEALLRHGSEPDLGEALALYALMRRWHVRLYQGMSAAFTPQYQSDSRVLPVLRDRFFAPLSVTPPVRGLLTRLVCGDLIPPLAGV